jgi:hypothetical protein
MSNIQIYIHMNENSIHHNHPCVVCDEDNGSNNNVTVRCVLCNDEFSAPMGAFRKLGSKGVPQNLVITRCEHFDGNWVYPVDFDANSPHTADKVAFTAICVDSLISE